MDKFKYTIREYNDSEKYMVVDYDDGSWARIVFMKTIPTNQSELDTLVSQFTRKIEQIEVQELDGSFVKELVGREIEATRFSFLAPSESPSTPTNPYADTLDEMDADLIEETVTRILIKKGIISE